MNPSGMKEIIEELDFAAYWGRENNRPVWLGEFGVTTNADAASRVRWTEFLAREAEKRGMTWAYWDFGGACKIYDIKNDKWNQELLKALIK